MSGTTPTTVDATNFTAATDAQVKSGVALIFGVQDGTQNTAKPVGLTMTPQQIADLVPDGGGGGGGTSYTLKSVSAPYTLSSADTNCALLVDTSAGGIVAVPAGLPTTFSCLITQSGMAQVVVTPGSGVTINAWEGRTATAGEFAQIVLDATAQDVYQLGGNTATSSATAPPALVPFAVNVATDTAVGTQLFTVQPVGDTSGASYAIIAGNSAGYFAINASTGAVTLAAAITGATPGNMSLTISGTDPYGTSTEVGTVNIISATYNPAGALAWLQPRNPNSAGLVDTNNDGVLDSFGFLTDALGSGLVFVAASNTTSNPRPAIGQANGLETANFSQPTSQMTGGTLAKTLTNGASYFGLEMVVSIASIAAVNAILKAAISSTGYRFNLSVNTSGLLTLQLLRLDTDTLVTIQAGGAGLIPGYFHYLYIGVNYQTGAVLLQVDELVEPATAFFSSGNGAVSPTNLYSVALGDNTGATTTINVAECTFYSADPSAQGRAANLAALRLTYGIPAFSPGGTTAPALPTTPNTIKIGSDTSPGLVLANYSSTTDSGKCQYSVASGNSAGQFSFGAYNANLQLAKAPVAGTYSLELTASNSFGGAPQVPVTVTIVPVTYSPVADGAWAWFQPRNGQFTTVSGGLVTAMLDRGASGRGLVQVTSGITPPAYVAAGFNGFGIATFTGTEGVKGNSALLALSNGTSYIGVEMCVSAASLATVNAFLQTVLSGGQSVFFLTTAVTTGKLSLITRRLSTDAAVTNTSATAALTADSNPHYLFVGVNYATGAVTIQVDGTIETFTAAWTGGVGSLAAVAAGNVFLGATTVPADSANVSISEIALYTTDPGATVRSNHRASFQATYGTP